MTKGSSKAFGNPDYRGRALWTSDEVILNFTKDESYSVIENQFKI